MRILISLLFVLGFPLTASADGGFWQDTAESLHKSGHDGLADIIVYVRLANGVKKDVETVQSAVKDVKDSANTIHKLAKDLSGGKVTEEDAKTEGALVAGTGADGRVIVKDFNKKQTVIIMGGYPGLTGAPHANGMGAVILEDSAGAIK